MKNIFLLFYCLLMIQFSMVFGQGCPINATSGTNPGVNILAVADGSSQSFNCTGGACTGLTLWYVFNVAFANCNPNLIANATIPFNFKLYGPYTTALGTEVYPITPLNSGIENNISQSIAMVNMGGTVGHYVLAIKPQSCNGTISFNFGSDCFGFSPIGLEGTEGQNSGETNETITTMNCPGCINYPQSAQSLTNPVGTGAECTTCPLCYTCAPMGSSTNACYTCPPVYGVPCNECIPDFAPNSGRYMFSCWVKDDNADFNTTTYTDPVVKINAVPFNDLLNLTLSPSGPIIDGWQKIESVFDIPSNPAIAKFKVEMDCAGSSSTGNCLFDDIRISPFDASMKTYVYDPTTLRFMAELDERNFATLYEYDEEGKLIRVKKETERGVMTIQENRNYTIKTP